MVPWSQIEEWGRRVRAIEDLAKVAEFGPLVGPNLKRLSDEVAAAVAKPPTPKAEAPDGPQMFRFFAGPATSVFRLRESYASTNAAQFDQARVWIEHARGTFDVMTFADWLNTDPGVGASMSMGGQDGLATTHVVRVA